MEWTRWHYAVKIISIDFYYSGKLVITAPVNGGKRSYPKSVDLLVPSPCSKFNGSLHRTYLRRNSKTRDQNVNYGIKGRDMKWK